MIFNGIISKLVSESLLSLYPVFVKKIDLSILLQLWTRLITYVLISVFFVNYAFISESLFSKQGLLLSLVNLFHIYSSYEGFNNLDSGVSFSIFNIYPLMILLFSGVMWKSAYFVTILGLFMFILDNYINTKKTNNANFNYGLIMLILAAITEAIIFFIIKEIKTDNSWNHLFLSYLWGSVILTIYLLFNKNDCIDTKMSTNIVTAIIINGIIGTIGYYLRFYSIYRLSPDIYAILSFFGIIMAYIYGILFNNEKINIYKIIGTIFIMVSNYYILFDTNIST
jgi:drug/metabolite transporter (DMT)-like permease